jgi:hypothetical protein
VDRKRSAIDAQDNRSNEMKLCARKPESRKAWTATRSGFGVENRRRDYDCRRFDAVGSGDRARRQRHRVQDPACDLAENFAPIASPPLPIPPPTGVPSFLH